MKVFNNNAETLFEIKNNLSILVGIMLEKQVDTPDANLHVEANTDRDRVMLYAGNTGLRGKSYVSFYGTDEVSYWAAAKEFLEDLPSKEETNKATFNNLVGGLIDTAKKLGIDEEFVKPLKETRKALTENLLTYTKENA